MAYATRWLGCGGIGDCLLLIARTYDIKHSSVKFYSLPGSKDLVQAFFDWFNIKAEVKDRDLYSFGEDWKSGDYLGCHLPDSGSYFEWLVQADKYLARINPTPKWKGYKNKGYVLIQPCGSNFAMKRRRHFSQEELEKLLKLFENKKVFCIGSPSDKEHYEGVGNWMCYDNNMPEFMAILNGASGFVGVDSWLKTWTCLLGLPTFVFLNRYYEQEVGYGSDGSDFIFLSKKLWKSLRLISYCNMEKLQTLV